MAIAPLPATGPISFSNLRTLGGSATANPSTNIKFSDYYRGTSRVVVWGGTASVPASGAIALSQFRNVHNRWERAIAGVSLVTMPPGLTQVEVLLHGGGGGGGGTDAAADGGFGRPGHQLSGRVTGLPAQTANQTWILTTGAGGAAGPSNVNSTTPGGAGGTGYSAGGPGGRAGNNGVSGAGGGGGGSSVIASSVSVLAVAAGGGGGGGAGLRFNNINGEGAKLVASVGSNLTLSQANGSPGANFSDPYEGRTGSDGGGGGGGGGGSGPGGTMYTIVSILDPKDDSVVGQTRQNEEAGEGGQQGTSYRIVTALAFQNNISPPGAGGGPAVPGATGLTRLEWPSV
jgi:hypothetical protein